MAVAQPAPIACAARRHDALSPVPAVSPRRDPRQPAPRLRRDARRGRDRRDSRRRTTATCGGSFGEFLRFRWLSHERKLALVRIENLDAFVAALRAGQGRAAADRPLRQLGGATVAGIGSFPQMRGRFHFVRRAIKPDWLDRLVTRRFNARRLRRVAEARLARRDARPRWRAATRSCSPSTSTRSRPTASRSTSSARRRGRSRASRSSRSPPARRCVPATSWREPDGRHVLRFEAPMRADRARENTNEAIRLQHARLQRRARAARAAPPGAVVLGAPPLEDRRAQGAARASASHDARSIDARQRGLPTVRPSVAAMS